MNLSDTVRDISKQLNISLAEVARKVGQSPQNLSKKLNKGTLSFDEFEQILNVLEVGMDVEFTLPGEQSLSGSNNEQLLHQMKILKMQLDVERIKSQYFSDISYKYRTALSTVSGGLELAKKHADNPKKTAECLGRILPAVAELTRLIEDSPFNREAGTTKEPLSSAKPTSLKGKRILLVDDNDINREIVRELLEDSGIAVEEAVNGKDSVDKIESHAAGYYDLVLMDLVMPVMDGYKAAKAIRKLKSKKKASVSIVAMTASVSDKDRKAAEKAGMNSFMEKPLDLEKLFQTMRSL